ncbi:DUF4148 domain-containing protein [Herbaspirillum sp. LeCh32-8]|uniref:DUF4148 domain-containing protein n=1 Tax=Herbaspirillum sp. LeCh32-8 TaxID=2821356 RepID=UPI001AEA298C|nr:DUF4148 domain-containing protein [Herbaspirillum sp. LeCh32-8]MBP0599024.1 DUF4148 domain-containing protein [Herbaspirillum sp. LeCh32-8]
MNTKNIAKNLFAGLLLTTAVGAAMAEVAYPPETPVVSTKTRAEVIAELQQARANGEILVTDRYQDPTDKKFVSTKTRADVVAELKQARDNGEIVVSDQYPADKPFHSVLTRQQVKDELQQARSQDQAISNSNSNAL